MRLAYGLILVLMCFQFMVLPCCAQGPSVPAAGNSNAASGVSADQAPGPAQTELDAAAGGHSGLGARDGKAPDPADDIRVFAFLEELPVGSIFGHEISPDSRFAHSPHPMMQWRLWANKRNRFGQSLVFLLFFSLVSWALVPGFLRRAEVPVRNRFWSTLLTGSLVTAVGLTIVRAGLKSLIGWPLAIVTLGAMQLVMLVGLSLLVSMMGQSVGHLIRLQNWPGLGKREGWRRFTELLIGSILVALIVQIPPIGMLPRIGTRLAGLMALLGVGGLYRSRGVKLPVVLDVKGS